MPTTLCRRSFLLAGGLVLALPAGSRAAGAKRISALFAGKVDDRGFMQAGYQGLLQARDQLGVDIAFTEGIAPQEAQLADALRALAKDKPDLVIAHGGQNNGAAKLVAADFPDVRFVVTQGNVTGANLASYEVLQEDSAFLAGVLAALTSKSGIIGHMSGIRVTPGLKGRAAYINGALYAKPSIRVLTNFSGNQDDNALSKRIALAMIDKGADVIFTMLNSGRTGAIEACRERKVPQIGNVIDWTKTVPDVFVGSAVANVGLAVFNATQDFLNGAFAAGMVRKVGLEHPDAVRLTVAPGVPETIRSRIEAASTAIIGGRLKVSTEWSGEEFPNPA